MHEQSPCKQRLDAVFTGRVQVYVQVLRVAFEPCRAVFGLRNLVPISTCGCGPQVDPHEEWLPPFGPVDGLRMRFLPAEPPVQNGEAAVEAQPPDKELSGAGTGLAVGTTI